MAHVNAYWYHKTISLMREFFISKGFIEVHTQSRPSLLTACDDPSTITTYEYSGEKWLLPQTSQLILETELLKNPDLPGVFSCSTSYRQEKTPIPGRHENIFPIFEFETHGDISRLQSIQTELLKYLGFEEKIFKEGVYEVIAASFGAKKVTQSVETQIGKKLSPVFFLNTFPEFTNPTWDMKRDGAYARKLDTILYGVETIGGAERSCNSEHMRERFYNFLNGVYAEELFKLFGKNRVERELNSFLNQNFFPRCGASVGVTRMIRALKLKENTSRIEDILSPTQAITRREQQKEKSLNISL